LGIFQISATGSEKLNAGPVNGETGNPNQDRIATMPMTTAQGRTPLETATGASRGDSPQHEYSVFLNRTEGRLIMQALAELPFKYVYELIGKLNHQANEITAGDRDAPHFQLRRLSLQELHLMIRALEEMPFRQVHDLLANLNAQISDHQKGWGYEVDPSKGPGPRSAGGR
jgi:hypothetical protein